MNHIDTLKNIKAGFEKDEWMADDVDALDCAIKALENQKSTIEELENLVEVMKKRVRQVGHSDSWYMGGIIMISIVDKRLSELKGENDAKS